MGGMLRRVITILPRMWGSVCAELSPFSLRLRTVCAERCASSVLFPFHCWPMSSPWLIFPFHCWGWRGTLLGPYPYPFHCWRIVPASSPSPVSLLGIVLLPFTRFTVGHTHTSWPPDPSVLDIPDIPVTYETSVW